MVDLIIAGGHSKALAIKVSRITRIPYFLPELKKFPDGEKYVRIDTELEDKTIAVIQSMALKPDEYLIEYYLMVKTLKDLGAKKVIGIIPYFAYARQDERFKPGEAISFAYIAKLIEAAGTDEIYTIDTHMHRVLDIEQIFTKPVKNVTAVPLLTEYFIKNYNFEEPVVIGPDAEAIQWAKVAAEILKAEYDVLEKQRLSGSEVEIKTREVNVKDRDVFIVDDIISTGGTIIEATKVLKKNGAKRIVASCTHPILVMDFLPRMIANVIHDVFLTDTVPMPISYVTVAPVIAEILGKNK